MNLLKKFVRNDNVNLDEDYGDESYVMPEDLKMELPTMSEEEASAVIDNPARKEPIEVKPTPAEKVAVKLLQPKSQGEAVMIADKVKEGCIVVLDIGLLEKEQTVRLVDFLAGVAYVMGGEMMRTNRNTIVISPAGVDVSGFASDMEESSDEEKAEESEESEPTEN